MRRVTAAGCSGSRLVGVGGAVAQVRHAADLRRARAGALEHARPAAPGDVCAAGDALAALDAALTRTSMPTAVTKVAAGNARAACGRDKQRRAAAAGQVSSTGNHGPPRAHPPPRRC